MKLTTYTLNQIGGRKNVEDSIYPASFQQGSPAVFVVCDGVGGSNHGEVASQIASKMFYEALAGKAIASKDQFEKIIRQTVVKFKDAVDAFVQENPAGNGTSTTLTVAMIVGDLAYIAWCGDSKIYQIRNGNIHYRSLDHSLVAELVKQGVITEEQAITHPQRNVITRSLSQHTKSTDVDVEVLSIKQGDWLLLCTDGLLEQFNEARFSSMFSIFQKGRNYAGDINAYCEGKTGDNYSMYLVHVDQVASKGGKGKTLLIIGLLIALIGGYLFYQQQSTDVSKQTLIKEKNDGDTSNIPLLELMNKKPDSSKKLSKEDSLLKDL